MRYDIRPRWQRWCAPPGREHLVLLSVAWFMVGLVGFLAAEVIYGWRAAPIDHAWHAAAWLVLSSWLVSGKRLHRPHRRSP